MAAFAVADAAAANEICRDGTPLKIERRIRSGDANLYLDIRGRNCGAPVILWLHGGPGGAERPLFRLYDGALEERFTVVYWDQRGTGRSYDKNAPPSELTVRQHLDDLHDVVGWLRQRFQQRKIVLLGHSWGTALALLYAKAHPEDVAQVIGANQFVSGRRSEEMQFRFVGLRALHAGDRRSLEQLHAIGPPPFAGDEILDMQDLVDRFGGLFHTRPSFALATLQVLLKGSVQFAEIPGYIAANNISLRAMHEELFQLDLSTEVSSVAVPVAFLLGCYDHQLHAHLAEHYLSVLEAPKKTLVWFGKSAHNIPFEEPDKFTRVVSGLIDGNISPDDTASICAP